MEELHCGLHCLWSIWVMLTHFLNHRSLEYIFANRPLSIREAFPLINEYIIKLYTSANQLDPIAPTRRERMYSHVYMYIIVHLHRSACHHQHPSLPPPHQIAVSSNITRKYRPEMDYHSNHTKTQVCSKSQKIITI